MIRLSVIVPPPPGQSRRSGVMVVDLDDIEVSDASPSTPPHQLRFEETASQPHSPQPGKLFAQIRCRRFMVGCSAVSEPSAVAVLTVSSLIDSAEFGEPGRAPLLPLINFFNAEVGSDGQSDAKTTINVDIPSTHVSISKEQWDSLQYWIDDLTQGLERMGSAAKELAESRNASIIGSRYFTTSQRGSTFDSTKSIEAGVTMTVTVNVTEGELLRPSSSASLNGM